MTEPSRRRRRVIWLGPAALVAAIAVVLALVLSDSSSGNRVTDETGAISVSVPEGWDDVEGSPLRTGDAEYPYVLAGPDLDAYRGTDDAPGAEVLRVGNADRAIVTDLLEETARRLDASGACTSERDRPHAVRGFEGRVRAYTGCGDAEVEWWLYVLAAPEGDAVVVIGVRGADEAERRRLVESVTQPG